jgi:hypothetical protein
MMRKLNSQFGLAKPRNALAIALLTATALGGCAQLQEDLEAAFKPRIELLSEIEQDLYRGILASDKIEQLRKTPTTRALKKAAAATTAAKTEVADATDAVVDAGAEVAAETADAVLAKDDTEAKTVVGETVYLSRSEVNPVQMSFQGDASTFFKKIADDIDYKIVEEGGNRVVDLNIKANGEPLFGVAIRAANYVEQDMSVRFDMEKKIIRIEYLDG